jgi:HK97 family phage major capsid protein
MIIRTIGSRILMDGDSGGAGGGGSGGTDSAIEAVQKKLRTAIDAATGEAKETLSRALEDSKKALGEESKAAIRSALEDATKALKEAGEALKRDLERERAQSPGRQDGGDTVPAVRALKEAMAQSAKENRAVTIGQTGQIQIVPTLVTDAIKNFSRVTKGFSYFFGPNADTIIPLIGVPEESTVDENGTIIDDEDTDMTVTEVKPVAHVVQLPISAEALLMSGANIESQLPSLFTKAFGRGMASGSMQGLGTGKQMSGMFLPGALTHTKTCAAVGAPTWFDLIDLVLAAKDYWDDAVLYLNPTFISQLIAVDDKDPLVTSFLLTGKILDMETVTSGYAPEDTASGKVVAVAQPAGNFGVGVAQQMMVQPITPLNSTKQYFRATMFYNGKVISKANGFQLLAK